MHQQLCLRLKRDHHLSSKINAERTHSTSQKIAYDSKMIINFFLLLWLPRKDRNETCSETMESHISFKWKSLDIISSNHKYRAIKAFITNWSPISLLFENYIQPGSEVCYYTKFSFIWDNYFKPFRLNLRRFVNTWILFYSLKHESGQSKFVPS